MKEKNSKTFTELNESDLEQANGGTLSMPNRHTIGNDPSIPGYPRRPPLPSFLQTVRAQKICPSCKKVIAEFDKPKIEMPQGELVACPFCHKYVIPDIVEIEE